MTDLKQYSLVRVVKLNHSAEKHDGWKINKRPPQIGDTGTVVEILKASGLPDRYVVESTQADGVTTWLSEFSSEEIELLE